MFRLACVCNIKSVSGSQANDLVYFAHFQKVRQRSESSTTELVNSEGKSPLVRSPFITTVYFGACIGYVVCRFPAYAIVKVHIRQTVSYLIMRLMNTFFEKESGN